MAPSIMDHVDDDSLFEILLRLPVQSLLRFKSVCRSWYALIRSPDFTHRHATFEGDDKSNKLGTFIFQYRHPSLFQYPRPLGWDEMQNHSPRFFSLSGNQFEVCKDLGMLQLHKQQSCHHIYMAGSCHGIICLYDAQHRNVYLWNPATKQFRLLPKSLTLPDGFSSYRHDFVAFGFDVKVRDYKVLKVTSFVPKGHHNAGYTCRVQLYNLKTDCWRYIDADPNTRGEDIGCNRGRYVNGKYYLSGHKYNYGSTERVDMILSFDFTEETFRTLHVMKDSNSCKLAFIGEKVACIIKSSYSVDYNNASFEVWGLNECYRKGSACWTKQYKIGPMPDHENLIAISKNGRIGIIRDNRSLQMCNLVTQEVKDLQCAQSMMMVCRSDAYKETLVSVERHGC